MVSYQNQNQNPISCDPRCRHTRHTRFPSSVRGLNQFTWIRLAARVKPAHGILPHTRLWIWLRECYRRAPSDSWQISMATIRNWKVFIVAEVTNVHTIGLCVWLIEAVDNPAICDNDRNPFDSKQRSVSNLVAIKAIVWEFYVCFFVFLSFLMPIAKSIKRILARRSIDNLLNKPRPSERALSFGS